VEFSRELHERARGRFAGLANVEFRFGDSRTELPKILQQFSGLGLFWLDAHWSGSVTYGEGDECPLLAELAVLAASGREALVMIDDARCFLAPPALPHRAAFWPTVAEVCAALAQLPPNYIVVFEDVIISVPLRFRPVVEQHCQLRATAAGKGGGKPKGRAKRWWQKLRGSLAAAPAGRA
jgi:hypothetical protein